LRHLFYALNLIVESTPKSKDAPPEKSFTAPRHYQKHLKSFVKTLLKQVAEKLDISWSLLRKPVISTNVNTPSSLPLENEKTLSLMELYQKGQIFTEKCCSRHTPCIHLISILLQSFLPISINDKVYALFRHNLYHLIIGLFFFIELIFDSCYKVKHG
jgi:hypothetical protein